MIANRMTKIEATEVAAPPAWALMERNLIALMEESGRLFARQYFERGGGTLLAEDVDDLYEQVYNFGLFYAIGAADDLLDLHFRNWNAVTRISDDRINHRTRYNDHKKVFRPSIHNEFWNLDQAMEWHHLGEGNMAFYDFGVADPTVSENMRRARSFAAMFIGEDPQAPNWDPEYRILRSPFHSSQGPKLHADAEYANTMLLAGRGLGGQANYYGVRASLYPIVKNLETRWFENPARRKQIVDLFDRLVLQCDTPNSLAATALVTNAYLYTGDDKYKQWVLNYTEAWMERTEKNGGICPDNVDAKASSVGDAKACGGAASTAGTTTRATTSCTTASTSRSNALNCSAATAGTSTFCARKSSCKSITAGSGRMGSCSCQCATGRMAGSGTLRQGCT